MRGGRPGCRCSCGAGSAARRSRRHTESARRRPAGARAGRRLAYAEPSAAVRASRVLAAPERPSPGPRPGRRCPAPASPSRSAVGEPRDRQAEQDLGRAAGADSCVGRRAQLVDGRVRDVGGDRVLVAAPSGAPNLRHGPVVARRRALHAVEVAKSRPAPITNGLDSALTSKLTSLTQLGVALVEVGPGDQLPRGAARWTA